MISTLVFAAVMLVPFGFYLFNAFRVRTERRGIKRDGMGLGIGGAPEIRKAWSRPTKLRIVSDEPLTGNCGRHLTHLVLTLSGSRGSCARCRAAARDDAGGGFSGSETKNLSGRTPDEPSAADAVEAAQRIIHDASKD